MKLLRDISYSVKNPIDDGGYKMAMEYKDNKVKFEATAAEWAYKYA